MPPCTAPSAIAALRLGDGQPRRGATRIVLVAPHAAHRRARDQRARRRSAAASWLATTSALMFSTRAARRRRPGRRAPAACPRASSASSSARSKPTTSPTKPKSTGSGPPPETTRGGRRCARDHAAARRAARRRARPPPRSAAHRSTLSLPGDDHLHDVERGRVGDAAARRRCRVSMPSRFCSAVACGPPPWTTTHAAPARATRAISRRRAASAGAASTSPPSLMTASTDAPRGYGHGPGSSSDAVSARPSMRFMFWIAWPAPPLIRLSVALTNASVRLPVDAAARPA